ncbi:hypothetical protein NMG60_11009084 [Bertholletia excelsa]
MMSGTTLQTCVLFWMIYRTTWNKEIRQWVGQPEAYQRGVDD